MLPQMMPLPWLFVFFLIFICFFSVNFFVCLNYFGVLNIKVKNVTKSFLVLPW